MAQKSIEEIAELYKGRTMFPAALERAKKILKNIKIDPNIFNDMKKTITYFYAPCGTIFWDQNGVIITGIHENDGNYRPEYFDSLFTHFGIKIECAKKRPEWLTDEMLDDYGLI